MSIFSTLRQLLPFRFSTGRPQSRSATLRRSGPQTMVYGNKNEFIIQLADIPTIGQLYGKGLLTAPSAAQALYEVNASLLERISIHQGDITKIRVDSIVNAANKSLLGGGGVDGTIHRAAGPHLLEECKRDLIPCRTLNGCRTGESKITRGYELPSRHVIHTVGPIYTLGEAELCAAKLASCYRTSLMVGVENGVRHIAFPSVSTGVYSYPIEDATKIALDVVRQFLDSETGSKLERVIFVVWSERDRQVYESCIPQYFPPEQSNNSSSVT